MLNLYFENGKQMLINRSIVMNTKVATDTSDETVDRKPQNLQRILFLHESAISM